MTLFDYNPERSQEIGGYSYLTTVNGYLNAEFLRGYLVSNGIEPYTFKEAVSEVYPVNVASLGEVDFYVLSGDLETARELLKNIDNEH